MNLFCVVLLLDFFSKNMIYIIQNHIIFRPNRALLSHTLPIDSKVVIETLQRCCCLLFRSGFICAVVYEDRTITQRASQQYATESGVWALFSDANNGNILVSQRTFLCFIVQSLQTKQPFFRLVLRLTSSELCTCDPNQSVIFHLLFLKERRF